MTDNSRIYTGMEHFHPAVSAWFNQTFESPTQPQLDAWRAISSGNHALVAAPTGSGKTLAAFMEAINQLVKQSAAGTLKQEVSVVYVSPLKALSNDIQRNLEDPLAGIQQELANFPSGSELAPMPVEAAVRTGDTPQWQRTKMRRNPPHILVTTPESLYILLTSESGRGMLSTTRTLIIDEIHAMVGSKRGAHLALSMERLENLCGRPLTRIGLSATQEPVDLVAGFLTGVRPDVRCEIIDSGHRRDRDLQICLPDSPLEAVMAGEVWGEVYGHLEALIEQHSTTLIFVNTRRLAERLAKALAERLGDEAVTSHHGSLAKEHRFSAEQRLKSGTLKALVATASLELGIDIGDIDLVCQIGSPRAVSVFLQRVGRSGHSLGKTPRGRLFPLSRDDLVECIAVIDAVNRSCLDQLSIYPKPLDVLAQQVVAEVASGELNLDELYRQFCVAAPYKALKRSQFDEVISMLAEGFSTRRGRRSAYIHLDAVNGRIRPRKSARLTAITNGGTIPDQFDYDVILQPENLKIGTLNEDFSFESLPGDIFQLGNTSYQIIKVELGKVFVLDAKGQPPNIPFWMGEAPGRSDTVSQSVSALRENMDNWLDKGLEFTARQVQETYHVPAQVSSQLVAYLGAAHAALGALPTCKTVIFERFFDEAGDQHLVIHSSFGSRVNRAWGLALRKRFCRKFNFELQAAALEDTIVLSLGSTHSFPLEEPAGYLKSATVKEVLTQALLDAPMFPTHWRWNASIALAIRRFSNGKKTPPQFQRSNAEDLIAVVFPDQIACAENIAGQREIPDHPLVDQTLYDCLHDLMDVTGLQEILQSMESGELNLVFKDLTAPSPLSDEVLTAKPYAFLDDAPAEERRTALVRTRQYLHPEDAAALDQLDQGVIDEVREEAWPHADNEDECHDALLILGGITESEATSNHWQDFLSKLSEQGRACVVMVDNSAIWVAAERLGYWYLLHPGLQAIPDVSPIGRLRAEAVEGALVELIRMRLQGLGPVTETALAAFFAVEVHQASHALGAIEQEGFAMQGFYDSRIEAPESERQWCERGLLARIHQRTIRNLRKQVAPISINGFMRFLFHWQGLDSDGDSPGGDPEQLAVVLAQLEGVEASAGAWEESLLTARISDYMPYWLDILCTSGRVTWARLNRPGQIAVADSDDLSTSQWSSQSSRQTPLAFLPRAAIGHWMKYSRRDEVDTDNLSAVARQILVILESQGAQFFEDLLSRVGGIAAELERGLSELVSAGLASSDNFAGMRGLIGKKSTGQGFRRRRRTPEKSTLCNAGRWSLVSRVAAGLETDSDAANDEEGNAPDRWESVEYIARVLLRRYGVVFRKLLDNERNVPPWRDLQYVLRRMESRGEIRGGRFINGLAGEQFALPEAVGLLRKQEQVGDLTQVSISAADPLNLTGTVIPGPRVPANRKNRLLFMNGELAAKFVAGEIQWFVELDARDQWQARQKLVTVSGTSQGKFQHHRRPHVH